MHKNTSCIKLFHSCPPSLLHAIPGCLPPIPKDERLQSMQNTNSIERVNIMLLPGRLKCWWFPLADSGEVTCVHGVTKLSEAKWLRISTQTFIQLFYIYKWTFEQIVHQSMFWTFKCVECLRKEQFHTKSLTTGVTHNHVAFAKACRVKKVMDERFTHA